MSTLGINAQIAGVAGLILCSAILSIHYGRAAWLWYREGQRARRIRYMAGLHESMLRHPSRRGRV